MNPYIIIALAAWFAAVMGILALLGLGKQADEAMARSRNERP